jgi:hypothetical protein
VRQVGRLAGDVDVELGAAHRAQPVDRRSPLIVAR